MKAKLYNPLTLFTCVLAAIIGAGCSSTQYEHGVAYRQLFQAQVANPAAPRDPSPVDGMTGFVSEGIFNERYLEEIVESEDEKNRRGRNSDDALSGRNSDLTDYASGTSSRKKTAR